MSACADCRELLGGYVLGALGPEDTALVERHLEDCPSCGREYAELASLPELLDVAGLADAEPEAPPASLEEAVLDRFARERRGQSPPSHRRWRPLRVGAALGAAAAAVVIALTVAGVFSSSTDEAFGHVRMTGRDGGANAELRAVQAGTQMRLEVWGLERARGGGYEVWCISKEGRWWSGGTFDVGQDGRAEVDLTSAARPGDYKRLLVTQGSGDRRGIVLAGRVKY